MINIIVKYFVKYLQITQSYMGNFNLIFSYVCFILAQYDSSILSEASLSSLVKAMRNGCV